MFGTTALRGHWVTIGHDSSNPLHVLAGSVHRILAYLTVLFISCQVAAVNLECNTVPDLPADCIPELSVEARLTNYLLRRYRQVGRIARPVHNATSSVDVEFGLGLIQVLDFDETNQVLTTSVWKRFKWKDEYLTWLPSDFSGTAAISLPANELWVPDIQLYNKYEKMSIADVQEKMHDEYINVEYTGVVRWVPPAIYKSSCQIDMRDFPFDEQTCMFKFGSWAYNGNKLTLAFNEGLVDLDMREFVESSEWDVMHTSAEKHVRVYPCCPDEPYPDLTFYLTLRRRTAFYVYVLILPSVLLSSLTLVLFWIPPQRPDRTSLGMSLFSSFYVLLLILVQSSPPTSASISLLGVYYCINMVLIAISTMLSAVVINMTYYLQRKRVPRFARMVLINGLARVLCAHTDSIPYKESEETFPMVANNDPHKNNGLGNTRSSGLQHPVPRMFAVNYNAEWRCVASVIDRIFFLLYIVGITLALIFVFPR